MNTAVARLDDGGEIRYCPDRIIGEGSEKTYFATEDDRFVLGFYKTACLQTDPRQYERLVKIVGEFNPTRDPATGDKWKSHFCWPEAVVREPRLGILSPRFPGHFYFDHSGAEQKCKWFTRPRLIRMLPPAASGDLKKRLHTLIHLADAVDQLHRQGLAHTDLSGNNVLMNLEKECAYIIDIDSLVVFGIYPPNVVGTRGYMAPEIVSTLNIPLPSGNAGNLPLTSKKKLPRLSTDRHSLAVIIYEVLFLRHPLDGVKYFSDDPQTDEILRFGDQALFIEHPRDRSNRPGHLRVPYTALGHYLSSLFERAFIEGIKDPDRRPSAGEWSDALSKTSELLFPCGPSDCYFKWFVRAENGAVSCPHCGFSPKQPVPVLYFFRREKPGVYRFENRRVVVREGGFPYPKSRDSEAISSGASFSPAPLWCSFSIRDKTWYIRNESDRWMMTNNGTNIRPGGRLPLRDMLIIRYRESPANRAYAFRLFPSGGTGDEGFLEEVEMKTDQRRGNR